jgi:hypothetical protein
MAYRYLALAALSLWSLAGFAQDAQTAQVSPAYALAVYANHSVETPAVADATIERAVIVVHGAHRNAQDYFDTGERLLAAAQWPDAKTLLIAPGFFTARDRPAGAHLPLWDSRWMQGRPSVQGQVGITPLRALDDLLAWVGDARHYPNLKQIVLIGHSAGGQLVQRHAVFSQAEQQLAARGIALRYVISSPSSYLYFDDRRPSGAGFNEQAIAQCPEVNHYRYGLEGLPNFLGAQPASRQLFQRYASTPITYLVGALDNDPNHRLLDKSCAAQAQGPNRLIRQQQYLAYEQLLGKEWRVPIIRHVQAQVPGAGHSAKAIYTSPVTVKLLETNLTR